MEVQTGFQNCSMEDVRIMYKNVIGTHIADDYKMGFLIRKIKEAISNNNDVFINKFEVNNSEILDKIKIFIFEGKVNELDLQNVTEAFRFWGILEEDSYREVKLKLQEKYRCEFISHINTELQVNNKYELYLEYILYLNKIYKNKNSHNIYLKELQEHIGKGLADTIIKFLFTNKIVGKIVDNNGENIMTINKKYIDRIMIRENFISEIKSLYNSILKEEAYDNFVDDLYKIYNIQKETYNAINIDKLNLLSKMKTDILIKYKILERVPREACNLIRLTSLGWFLVLDEYKEDLWNGHKYRIVKDNEELVTKDDDPYIITKLLFNKDYEIVERDFVFKFKKSECSELES